MANYRTLKELKPYRGYPITRLHKDGVFYYFSEDEDGEEMKAKSLKELKKMINEEAGPKEYEFVVRLCGGYANGTMCVVAKYEDDAYEKALEIVGKKLFKAFPDLDIEYAVEFV